MRYTHKNLRLSSNNLSQFFAERAAKYDSSSPDVSVLYSDLTPEIAKIKSEAEFAVVRHFLPLRGAMSVLDIGCGIGRWANLLQRYEPEYVGTDTSSDLIHIAKQRFEQNSAYEFHVASTCELESLVKNQRFDVVIISGLINYLNEDEVSLLFDVVGKISKGSTVYIRASHATGLYRLTLVDEWSEELASTYSSIYRTVEETWSLIKNSSLQGFTNVSNQWLFGENTQLNHRSETRQYFWILCED